MASFMLVLITFGVLINFQAIVNRVALTEPQGILVPQATVQVEEGYVCEPGNEGDPTMCDMWGDWHLKQKAEADPATSEIDKARDVKVYGVNSVPAFAPGTEAFEEMLRTTNIARSIALVLLAIMLVAMGGGLIHIPSWPWWLSREERPYEVPEYWRMPERIPTRVNSTAVKPRWETPTYTERGPVATRRIILLPQR